MGTLPKCHLCGREASHKLTSGNYWCAWCGQAFTAIPELESVSLDINYINRPVSIKEMQFPIRRPPILLEKFPDCPVSIPWSLIESHAKQAEINHGKTLPELAADGGLDPMELYAVLHNQAWNRELPIRRGRGDAKIVGAELLSEEQAIIFLKFALQKAQDSERDMSFSKRLIRKRNEKRIINPFLTALRNEDWYVREKALNVIRALKPIESVRVNIFRRFLRDKHHRVRRAAAETLASLNDKGAESMLICLLMEDRYAIVRRSAAEALRELQWQPESDIQKCWALVQGGGGGVNESLSKMGDSAVKALMELWRQDKIKKLYSISSLLRPTNNHRELDGRKDIILGLNAIQCEAANDALLITLTCENEYVRRDAIVAIGERRTLTAVDALIKILLSDTFIHNRICAAASLAKIRARQAIPALIQALSDNSAIKYLDQDMNEYWVSVSDAAHNALEAITGIKKKMTQLEWEKWWSQNNDNFT